VFGEPKTQGQRTDLINLYKKIKQGELKNVQDVMDYDFNLYARYRGGIKEALSVWQLQKRKEFRKVEVEYVYGPTGTGKTKYLYEHKDLFKINGSGLNWFDGYQGESVLGIDEYDNNMKCSDLLSLLDGYQKRLPIKGGFTYANWTKVVITSNLNPRQLHEQAKNEHRKALWRRVTACIQMEMEQKIIHGKDKFEGLCYEEQPMCSYGFVYD